MSNTDCIFCNIPQDKLIAENDFCFAIYDDFPVSKDHVLIIPKRHVADYFSLTEDEVMAIQIMLREIKTKLDEDLSPDGYNVGINVNEAAGQTVFHVHVHLIPRFKGDVENPRGGVRGVIPHKQNY